MRKNLIGIIACTLLLAACHQQKTDNTETISNNMQFRSLGNTGLTVSEIGIGCGCFENKDTAFSRQYMTVALDSGINYIDIYTSDPTVRDNIGYALKGRRDKMIIQGHIGSVWQNGQYKRTRDLNEIKEGFQDLLTRLQTDHIEVGMIHIADNHEDWLEILNGPVMQYAQELKAKGIIKHIGLSSHNPQVALEAVKSGKIEVLMFTVNPLFDLLPADANLFDAPKKEIKDFVLDSVRQQLYSTCQSMQVGLVVMKVFGGGRLLDAKQSAFGKALTPCQCIQYSLDRPAVATVLSGADNIEELLASLHYLTATKEEKDYATALNAMENGCWKGECTYCGHCSPCPAGIDIDEVTKLLNMAKAEGVVSESVRNQYKSLAHKAGECTQCGACEEKCPFGVPVRDNMKKAKELFGE